jgi:hypothetical protein
MALGDAAPRQLVGERVEEGASGLAADAERPRIGAEVAFDKPVVLSGRRCGWHPVERDAENDQVADARRGVFRRHTNQRRADEALPGPHGVLEMDLRVIPSVAESCSSHAHDLDRAVDRAAVDPERRLSGEPDLGAR